MNKTGLLVAPLLVSVALAGCKKDEKKDEKKEGETTEKVTTGSGEAKPDPGKKVGLEDPTNNPDVVKAAKQLLADCGATLDQSTENSSKPNQKKSYYSCEKWGADFGDIDFRDGPYKDKKDVDLTFVNFLEDPDVKVRAIGVSGLSRMWDWQSDKALAERVVKALKNEKAPSPIDHNLALRVGDISESAGLQDQIKAIGLDPNTSMDVKLALMAWWRGPAAYEIVKAHAATTDMDMVNAVVQGYVLHFEDHTEEACTYWADHLETTNKTANEYALGHLTGGWGGNTTGDSESEDYISGGGGGPGSSDKRCSEAQLMKAVDLIDKRFSADDTASELTYALAFMAKDEKSPPPVKAKTVEILKKMVEKPGHWLRSTALRALFETGDADLQKYAQKFKDDEDLKDDVEDLNKRAAEEKAAKAAENK